MSVLNFIAWQVRSHEIEAEFAATTAELRELKTKQKALEARNLLLEKLVKLNKQKPALKVCFRSIHMQSLNGVFIERLHVGST